MNGGKPVRAKRIPSGDHVVVIPSDITQTDDIVWMSHGRNLAFEHGEAFSLEFLVETPGSSNDLVFHSQPASGKHRLAIKLKQVQKMTACKYTIVVGTKKHDPIVIIDPNAPSNEN